MNKDGGAAMTPNKYFPCFVLKLTLVYFKVYDKAHLVCPYNKEYHVYVLFVTDAQPSFWSRSMTCQES